MNKTDLIREIVAAYQKHGWELKRILLDAQSTSESSTDIEQIAGGVNIENARVDALWFSRPSPRGYEAWELRLMAETPYALFEKIRAEESEESRSETLRNMEERLRQYVARK